MNEISFSYEKMGTKTRFDEEAKRNSEMAYLPSILHIIITFHIIKSFPKACQMMPFYELIRAYKLSRSTPS